MIWNDRTFHASVLLVEDPKTLSFQLFITHRSHRVQISELVLVLLCIESEKRYAVWNSYEKNVDVECCVCRLYARVLIIQLNLFAAYINNIVDIIRLQKPGRKRRTDTSALSVWLPIYLLSEILSDNKPKNHPVVAQDKRCVTYKINE